MLNEPLRSKPSIIECLFISLILLLILCTLSVVLCGCEESGPEDAVKRYYDAWESGDWAKFKEAHAPGRSEFTPEEEELAKQQFEQVQIETEGLKMNTEYNEEDENRAKVTVVAGKITYTADILGSTRSETQDISQMEKEDRPWKEVVKVEGKWYVDEPPG